MLGLFVLNKDIENTTLAFYPSMTYLVTKKQRNIFSAPDYINFHIYRPPYIECNLTNNVNKPPPYKSYLRHIGILLYAQ